MNEKLIDLENELILVFPARLQKDRITFNQFKEFPQQDAIQFDIKAFNGVIITFVVFLVDGKIYQIKTKTAEDKFKKTKDLIKFIEKICGLR